MNRNVILTVLGLSLTLVIACSQEPAKTDQPPASQASPAAPPARKEHVFRGKVEKVDATAKMMTVAGEDVDGWMSAMTMTYSADKPDVYEKVKPGDQIIAKVYDGDFATLHDVQVVK